jgi:hypothetical protein
MNAPHPHEPTWLHRHAHEPNPVPPSPEPDFVVKLPDGIVSRLTVVALQALPFAQVHDCWIVSTGHGQSGPFTFGGARLLDVLNAVLDTNTHWQAVDVVSIDGFGTRILAHELSEMSTQPILLSYLINGGNLTREQGLVRLIVPSETDDALRQVKWVSLIEVH